MSYDTNDLVNLGHLESVSKAVAEDIGNMQSNIASIRTSLNGITNFTSWGSYKVVSGVYTNTFTFDSTFSYKGSYSIGTYSDLGISSVANIVNISVSARAQADAPTSVVVATLNPYYETFYLSIAGQMVSASSSTVYIYWTIWYTEE